MKSPRHFILPFLLVLSAAAYAQPYVSRLGRFQVDQKKGCAPFSITLSNLLVGDCTAGKPCVMDYEGTQQQNQFTHTYTIPGTYKLSVLYQSIGADDITITVDQNIQPNFELYSCAGYQATIRVVDNNYDQYVIDFDNDGTPENILPFSNNIITPSHAYIPPPPQPATYTTSVRGRDLNSADNCTAKTQPFTTLLTLPTPRITTLTSIDNTSLKLDFAITTNILYRLEIAVNNSATFQLLQTVYGLNTLTLTNLKLDDNFYCYRLSAYDPCSGANTYSNIVCSDKFTVTAQSDVNQVAWLTAGTGSVINFTVARNGTNYFSTAAQSFNDTNIICKTSYCYRITTNYTGGNKSISLEKCVTAFSNKIPTAINDVSSVVSAAGVDLSWVQDPAFVTSNYVIFRASGTAPFSFYANNVPTKYTDAAYTTEGKFCYQINYTDRCDNVSAPGARICPVRLTGVLDHDNTVTLVWSSYLGWKAGVKNYVIEKYNLKGALISSILTTDTTFVDNNPDPTNQYIRYEIKAQPNTAGLALSLSNAVETIKNANLYYPTAFTPNADNLNDGFSVNGQFIVKMNLKIFDRWGGLVYSTDKNEPWDGTREGKPMPASTYVWKVTITDLAGRVFTEEGTVALMRN